MIPHYLACTDYGWACSHGNTVTPLFLLLVAAIIAALAGLQAWWRWLGRKDRDRRGGTGL